MWGEVIKQLDLIALAKAAWAWITTNPFSPLSLAIFTIAFLVFVIVFVWLFKLALDLYVGLTEVTEKVGWNLFLSREKKDLIRKRKGFCQMLQSDVVSLSKAESWNDQFFTDLDAEVEAEGLFYASSFDRIRKRSSTGIRRIPSLMRAIETSGDQFVVLIGEPGSGKSVALRHLAMEMTRKTIKSNGVKASVPLYINLKELEPPGELGFTAGYVKQFVLDNVRRGDADTVEYVRENWDSYRDSGQWFFLFDSFDEIPEVMHSPSGGKVIQNYSEAIRLFLSGMGPCRGVVASREFKGPEALPWPRVRALPLSPRRQELLLKNSMLNPAGRKMTMQHIGRVQSPLHRNPMFLALLCRHVKKTGAVPSVDHALLVAHISSLASRDEDYLSRKYNLTPKLLLGHAQEVAVLMAENPDLGLAPKYDDLREKLMRKGHPHTYADAIIAALVDMKIGRTDVQEARPGDRRFTFSHRRYQETLYVELLGRRRGHIPARTLLLDSSMREYTVTLLQSQSPDIIKPILEEAEKILGEYKNNPIQVDEGFGDLTYFEWLNDPATHVCEVLQAGMAARRHEVSTELKAAVRSVLQERWLGGDHFDRRMILEVGGMLPQGDLVKFIEYAVTSGEVHAERAAFGKVAFLDEAPRELMEWLTLQITEQTLAATSRAAVLRMEAFAFSLPEKIGARLAFLRASGLRRLVYPMLLATRAIDSILERVVAKIFRRSSVEKAARGSNYGKVKIIAAALFLDGAISAGLGAYKGDALAIKFGGILVLIAVLFVYKAWLCRVTGDETWWAWAGRAFRFYRDEICDDIRFFVLFAVFIMISALPAFVFDMVSRFITHGGPIDKINYAISSAGVIILIVAFVAGWDHVRSKKNARRLSEVKSNLTNGGLPIALYASSFRQLSDWTTVDEATIFGSLSNSRSLLRFIFAVENGQSGISDVPLACTHGKSRVAEMIMNRLIPSALL